jgi:KDO2-lipid IV(A) lauroyltransferase
LTPALKARIARIERMLRDFLDELRRHDSHLWRRAMSAGIARGPRAFVRYSPPAFGVAFAALLPRHRAAVLRNLRLALGKRSAAVEALDVARVFATYASCLTEAFIAGSDGGASVKGVAVHDERFGDALAQKKGVILATAHTGGWQVAGPVLHAGHDAELLVVMRRERDAKAQALQDDARERSGTRVIHIGDDPLDALPLLSHLRKGGVVAVQMDRLPRGMRGRKVELFGSPFEVPEGPLRLSAVSGAPVLPVFTRRLGHMEYEVEIGEPIRLPRRPAEADLDAAARKVMSEMEIFVRNNPTQWFHFE